MATLHSAAGSISSAETFYSVSSPKLAPAKNIFSAACNDSKLSLEDSIFERDVENQSLYTLSSTSINTLPTHYKNENLIAPALNASLDALCSADKDLKKVDVIYMNSNRTSEKLAAAFSNNGKGSSSINRNRSCSRFSSPRRVNTVSRATNFSVEDLVRERKNSCVSFVSYSDYLKEEQSEKEMKASPVNVNTGSFKSVLFRNATTSNLQSSPSPVRKNSIYSHSNNSNISVLEELKFKSMFSRRMSSLDVALQHNTPPKVADSPTASPVNFNQAYDANSALSSPIRLFGDDDVIDSQHIDMDFDVVDETQEFETVLENAFEVSYTYGKNSKLNICSLEQEIKSKQQLLKN